MIRARKILTAAVALAAWTAEASAQVGPSANAVAPGAGERFVMPRMPAPFVPQGWQSPNQAAPAVAPQIVPQAAVATPVVATPVVVAPAAVVPAPAPTTPAPVAGTGVLQTGSLQFVTGAPQVAPAYFVAPADAATVPTATPVAAAQPAAAASQAQIAVQPAVPSLPAAGPVDSFRLDELVGFATTYNPILRRAEAVIEGAKGERVQAGLYPNPAMETNNPEVFSGQVSYVNFGFQQFIVVKGKLQLDKAAADQLVRAETAEYRLERSRMVTDVRTQYYKTLAAKHRVYLARYLSAIAERGVGGVRQLEQAGEGTLTDVLLLDTEYQREQIQLRNSETLYEGELKKLAAVVGMPQIQIRDVAGSLFDIPPQFHEQDVQLFLNQTSTYIEKARAEITRSQIQLRRQEVEPYPNMRMGPSFQTGTIPKSSQFWLTVEFDIPVWNLNQGNIRSANASVQEQFAELEILRNELNRKTADLFARHVTSRERAEKIRTQILPNAQKAQSLIQDAYVKGQFDVNRLLESQRNLAEVSSDYFEAAEESWTTAAELAGMLQLEQFP
ncbi:MAG: TolC family protein [Pirellulales bacterium]